MATCHGNCHGVKPVICQNWTGLFAIAKPVYLPSNQACVGAYIQEPLPDTRDPILIKFEGGAAPYLTSNLSPWQQAQRIVVAFSNALRANALDALRLYLRRRHRASPAPRATVAPLANPLASPGLPLAAAGLRLRLAHACAAPHRPPGRARRR